MRKQMFSLEIHIFLLPLRKGMHVTINRMSRQCCCSQFAVPIDQSDLIKLYKKTCIYACTECELQFNVESFSEAHQKKNLTPNIWKTKVRYQFAFTARHPSSQHPGKSRSLSFSWRQPRASTMTMTFSSIKDLLIDSQTRFQAQGVCKHQWLVLSCTLQCYWKHINRYPNGLNTNFTASKSFGLLYQYQHPLPDKHS